MIAHAGGVRRQKDLREERRAAALPGWGEGQEEACAVMGGGGCRLEINILAWQPGLCWDGTVGREGRL